MLLGQSGGCTVIAEGGLSGECAVVSEHDSAARGRQQTREQACAGTAALHARRGPRHRQRLGRHRPADRQSHRQTRLPLPSHTGTDDVIVYIVTYIGARSIGRPRFWPTVQLVD